jgi:manganese oxidase
VDTEIDIDIDTMAAAHSAQPEQTATTLKQPSARPRLALDRFILSALLAYGGVGIVHWFQTVVLGSFELPGAWGFSQLMRDGTLALPFVAVAVWLGMRSRPGTDTSLPAAVSLVPMYAVVMGSGALLAGLFPGTLHGGHSDSETVLSTSTLLVNAFILMVAASAFAILVLKTLGFVDRVLATPLDSVRISRGWLRLGIPVAAILALSPVFVFSGARPAAAATTFPDQAIHPRGTLLLVAQHMDDGTLAYVAPSYGDLGIRPIIEMYEGETLNITLLNALETDVSLHVHGVLYSQDSDGTRHSNSFARPGESRVYQWRAAPGTAGYWHYHDHVVGDNEGSGGILNGLYGGLVVRKKTDPKPAKTFMLVFHDLTVNGRQYPDTPVPTARQGELVEFLVVSYMDRQHTFHLHAHRWLTPTRPADPSPSAAANAGSGREDNHPMSPGDSFGFMTIAGDGVGPGMWMYHCHVQSHSGLMMGFFNVLPPAAR